MMSNNPDDKTRVTDKQLNEQRERYLDQLQSDDTAAEYIERNAASAPTDRPQPATEQIATRDVIYAWQMLTEDGQWNIIAMAAVPGVPPMPLVTSRFDVAWEAFEVAQAHANRYQCEARLAVFRFDGVTAIVLPEGVDG